MKTILVVIAIAVVGLFALVGSEHLERYQRREAARKACWDSAERMGFSKALSCEVAEPF